MGIKKKLHQNEIKINKQADKVQGDISYSSCFALNLNINIIKSRYCEHL